MNFTFRTTFARASAAIVIASITHLLALTGAHAQGFQYLYGGTSCQEAGRSVIQLAAGGYATAGETFSTGAPCGQSDVYVVRTNANGTINWGMRYNIQGNDSATRILQASNGDFVVCGVCKGAVPPATRDIFVMRLNQFTGAVLMLRAYGTTTNDEIAWDMVEATTGNGVTTNPTDLIIAGSTTFGAGGTGQRDAYLLRITAALGLIWDRQYGGTASRDDFFYSLDEVTVPPPAAGTSGDIVAVGGTNTWGPALTGYNILVMRVSGDNGTIGAAPQNACAYSGAQDDIARSVQQLRAAAGGFAGDFIITGISKSRPAPSTNNEGFVLHIQPNPCLAQRSDAYFGDNAGGDDGGYSVREIRVGVGLAIGQVVVTGYTVQGAGGTLLGINAFLQQFRPGTNIGALPSGAEIYGGTGTDVGWSVAVATRNTATENPGFIVSGYSQSPNLLVAGDPQQLYLIKTRANRLSGCNELATQFSTVAANFTRTCVVPVNAPINHIFDITIAPTSLTANTVLCLAFPQAHDNDGAGNDGASGVSTPTTGDADNGTLSLYPNPVHGGTPIELRFTMPAHATADITVSNVVGAVIYHNGETLPAGAANVTIATKGWPSGTYIVDVAVGEKRTARTVVVIE